MAGKDIVPRPVNYPAEVPRPPMGAQPGPWSESGIVTIGRWARRDRHYTVPLAVPLVVWPAGAVLHAVHAWLYVMIAGVVLAAAMAVLAPHKWKRGAELAYVLASAVLAPLWLTMAALLGPAAGMPGIVLSSLLGAECAAWGFFWWRHKRPRGRKRREKLIAKWDAWWQSHCWHWNLGGSRVTAVWESGVTSKVRVQGIPGQHSIQYVNQVMHLIESSVEGLADVGMIRVEAVKGNPSQFDLFFKRENPLAQVVEYDPSLAPRSVHDSYAKGMTETGTWKRLRLRCNRFTIGESRSGKSNDLLVGIAALSGCPDGRQVLIDLKGGRSGRPLIEAAAVDYVITTVDEARMYLRMTVAEIQARAKYAYADEEQLLADQETPAVHTLIDEVHGLTSVANGDAECARLLGVVASQGMGLEEYVWVYTQYGSLEESVRTEQTRGNLTVRTVYRVAEARHGAYAIPEYNKLDASKLEETGTCYDKDGPKAAPEQERAPKMPHKLLRQVTAQNARLNPRPNLRLYCGDEMSPAGVTWQEWWNTRWLRLDPAFRDVSPQYQAAVAGHPREAVRVMREAAEAVPPPPEPVPGEGDGAQVRARIDAETAGVRELIPDSFQPSPRVVAKMKPAARQQKDAFADALAGASPAAGITPKQLHDESGMGRNWIHQMLAALTEADAVTRLRHGVYAPLDGADVHAAVRLVESGNDQLLRQARRENGGKRPQPVS